MIPDILFLLMSSYQYRTVDSPSKHLLFDSTTGQTVTAAFKAHDLRKTFVQAIAATEEDPEKTLRQFWKD